MRVTSLQAEQVLLLSKTTTRFTCPHLKNHSLQSKAEGRAKGVGVVGRRRPVKHNAHTYAKVARTIAAPLKTNESFRIAKVTDRFGYVKVCACFTCGVLQVFPLGGQTAPESDPTAEKETNDVCRSDSVRPVY